MSATFIIHTPTSIHKLKLLILNKSLHLINKVGVSQQECILDHNNSTIIDLNSHQHNLYTGLTYSVFDIISLLVPPSCEEGHLNVDERATLVHQQLLNDSVQNVLDCCMLDAVVSCCVIQCKE